MAWASRSSQQPAVRHPGQGVVVGQLADLLLLAPALGDVGEQAGVVGQLPLLVGDRGDGQPLQVQLTAFPAVPDFAPPVAVMGEGLPHPVIEFGIVATGGEEARGSAQNLFPLIAGQAGEGGVDEFDAGVPVGDHDAFERGFDHPLCQLQGAAGLRQRPVPLFEGLAQVVQVHLFGPAQHVAVADQPGDFAPAADHRQVPDTVFQQQVPGTDQGIVLTHRQQGTAGHVAGQGVGGVTGDQRHQIPLRQNA